MWNPTFICSFQDWEPEIISPSILTHQFCGRMVWRLKTNGKFDVRSYYEAMRGLNGETVDHLL